jgi:hypothetical protein
MALTKTELKLIAKLLDLANEEFSNHVSHDFEIENTAEHKKLLIDFQHWSCIESNDTIMNKEIAKIKKTKSKMMHMPDIFLMGYLADRCKKAAK